MDILKFKGVPVEINGKTYTMPPLSPYAYAKADALEKIKVIETEVKAAEKSSSFGELTPNTFLSLIELVHLALKRNYPEITEEEIGEGVADGTTLINLFQSLISQDAKARKAMETELAKNGGKQQAKM